MIMNTIPLLTFFLLLTISICKSQVNDTWQRVETSTNQNLFIDLAGLEHYTDDDIYVWVLENYNEPIELESNGEEAIQSKTYYLFNKQLKMYSLLEIIYYNDQGAITEYFNYWRDTSIDSYKYNYPIVEGSVEENILDSCVEFIDTNRLELE
ncbi:MAG: hypothetical protein HND52_02110 [Ignavibacteriae bacterium]|nr:hypothetical protein [Ignavibacteriota bacterium]